MPDYDNRSPRENWAFVMHWLVRAMKVTRTGQQTLECAEAMRHVDLMWSLSAKEYDYLRSDRPQAMGRQQINPDLQSEVNHEVKAL